LADEQVDWNDSDADGPVYWALTDHLGSVRDVVDSNGDLRIHREFDSFGKIVDETHYNGSGAVVTAGQAGYVDEAFAFTGRYFDADTGLQNNLNRWYDPSVGRWLSEDPIGFAAGDVNLYRYVGNSSTMRTDPNGLFPPESVWDRRLGIGPEFQNSSNAPTTFQPLPKLKDYRDWPVNSRVINKSGKPVWVSTSGGPHKWLYPGEATSPWIDEGDWIYLDGEWYKTGAGTLVVFPGGKPKIDQTFGGLAWMIPKPEDSKPPQAVPPPGPPPAYTGPLPKPDPPIIELPLLRPY
jgi:RHS repeat-associated protein